MSPARGGAVTGTGQILFMRSEQRTTVYEWVATPAEGWALRAEGRVHASLAPAERAWVAEAGEQAWTLQRVGFHRPRVVVRPLGALAEVAHAQADWRGIFTLHFASGPSWEIDPSHSGGTVVRDEAGDVVLRLTWNGKAAGACVHADVERAGGRFGPVASVVAGYLFLGGLDHPGRRMTVGVPFGSTARTRWN